MTDSGTQIHYSLSILLAVGRELLYDGVHDGIVEVQRHRTHNSHFGFPTGKHVWLQRVCLGDDIHGWQYFTYYPNLSVTVSRRLRLIRYLSLYIHINIETGSYDDPDGQQAAPQIVIHHR